MSDVTGFVPPPYPYDRLDRIIAIARTHDGGAVDLSIGTPCDPPPAAVIAALGSSNSERGYPPSIGTDALRGAIRDWIHRRWQIDKAYGTVWVLFASMTSVKGLFSCKSTFC